MKNFEISLKKLYKFIFYDDKGDSCEFATTCETINCQNSGTCKEEEDGIHVKCECSKNFYGQYCENQITEEICKVGDRNEVDCKIWEFYGFCSFSYTYNAVPVPIFCPHTCDLCSDMVCEDTQTNCGIWVAMGLCKNFNGLDIACRKSCGFCV
jgi:hypothetical protein